MNTYYADGSNVMLGLSGLHADNIVARCSSNDVAQHIANCLNAPTLAPSAETEAGLRVALASAELRMRGMRIALHGIYDWRADGDECPFCGAKDEEHDEECPWVNVEMEVVLNPRQSATAATPLLTALSSDPPAPKTNPRD